MGLIFSTATLTIASGAALSSAMAIGEKVPCALQMPAAWDAADITFQASDDKGVTWKELMDDTGTAIKLTAPAAGNRLNLAVGLFASCILIRLRSGTLALAVNQSASRTIVVDKRRFYPVR